MGVPGDPRLLEAIARRTPNVAGGGVSHVFGSTIVVPPKRSKRGTSAVTCSAFRLVKSATNKFTVSESTVAGLTPSGFTAGKKEFTVATTDGKVYAKLVINSSGEPVSATIEQAAAVPSDTATNYHRLIGTFHVEGAGDSAVLTLTQSNCGPFDAVICRNWFASAAPYYGLTWQ